MEALGSFTTKAGLSAAALLLILQGCGSPKSNEDSPIKGMDSPYACRNASVNGNVITVDAYNLISGADETPSAITYAPTGEPRQTRPAQGDQATFTDLQPTPVEYSVYAEVHGADRLCAIKVRH